jgi:hypothetical protein
MRCQWRAFLFAGGREDGTGVGGTEHAGWRSQVAKPGKVGRWRAGKSGNEPKRQTGSAAARGGRRRPRYINERPPRGTDRSSDRAPSSHPLGARRSLLQKSRRWSVLCSPFCFAERSRTSPFFFISPCPAGGGESEVSPSGSVVVAAGFAPADLTVVLLLGKLASLLGVFGVAIASRFHQPRSRFFPQSLTVPCRRRRRLCLPRILCS